MYTLILIQCVSVISFEHLNCLSALMFLFFYMHRTDNVVLITTTGHEMASCVLKCR